MSRPEDLLPPDLYYNDTESLKYTTSSRIQQIQSSMTYRALELLNLPTQQSPPPQQQSQPSFILDIGCGSGLSGSILSAQGHEWIGIDISPSMLDIALQNQSEGDLLLGDIGQFLPFRPGSFDAAISISAIQWLCNAESTDSSSNPEARLRRFFDSLYSSLKRGGRAVLQFYPRNEVQRDMISSAAKRAGFGGGIMEDEGGTKNVKTYLVLSVGGGSSNLGINGMGNVEIEDGFKRRNRDGNGVREKKGSKEWIARKKEKMRSKGKIVKSDSKYSGRSRRVRF